VWETDQETLRSKPLLALRIEVSLPLLATSSSAYLLEKVSHKGKKPWRQDAVSPGPLDDLLPWIEYFQASGQLRKVEPPASGRE
jgi:hypothetical protein